MNGSCHGFAGLRFAGTAAGSFAWQLNQPFGSPIGGAASAVGSAGAAFAEPAAGVAPGSLAFGAGSSVDFDLPHAANATTDTNMIERSFMPGRYNGVDARRPAFRMGGPRVCSSA